MSLLLSHNNHFKFGYNGKSFNFRNSPEDQWWVSYGPCTKEPLDFKNECIRTAKILNENAKAGIWLMFSGGVDSEVMVRSFLEAKVPFNVAILRYKNDLNLHDISYAVKACDSLGIKYHFFDLDLLAFWENRLLEYADPIYCMSPHLLPTMWLIDQIDGYPVLGSGECFLAKRQPPGYEPGVSPYEHSEWDLHEKERIAAWYRHMIYRNREGCMGFFQYTPEIILSYLRDPFVSRLTKSEIVGKLYTVSSKTKIYQQHFPLEDREKYHGFEKVSEQDAYYRKILVDKFPHGNQVHKSSVSSLLETLPR